ncbi:MAG: hypothetical protein CML68_14345 [Rhodobacteraceae bacterium]|nr:hypothetical protein [Paracoccaceae bacterium]
MWWSDRRSLLLALPLLAAGCGFTPVYGPDGIGTTLRGAIIADAPDSQEAYMLVRRLEEKLGRPANPTYRLAYTISTLESGQAVTAAGDITRYNLNGVVRYQLIRQADEAIVLAGNVRNFAGYSASGSPVDTLSAERDAMRRLMVILADQLVAELYTSQELPAGFTATPQAASPDQPS